MPLTHQDNGVSMGGTLKDVSTQKKCYIMAGSKDLLNSYGFFQINEFIGFNAFFFVAKILQSLVI
jgi:hypothetical protein